MLTPAKITNHHFEASGRNAYKAESVDTFIQEVAESYEQMFRENGEMFKKINLLAQRLEEYRNDEDNIRNALLTAQRAAEKITREAQEKADKLVADVKERTDTENERLDAAAKEMLTKAKYQADAIVEEAQKQAKEIAEKAIQDSKEAAVSARSDMIKELAALETMKQEVTKFKQQILGEYAAQVELIGKLPEVVIEKMTAEEETKEEEAPAEKPADEVKEEAAEPEKAEEPAEPTEEKAEKAQQEEQQEEQHPFEKTVEEVKAPEAREAESMDVEHLQQMIYETEDTDAESDPTYEEDDADEDVEETAESAEFVVPNIDDASDEELDKIVDDFDKEEKPEPQDIMFTKPKKDQKEKDGFKLKFENIDSYAADDSDNGYLDDLDDDDLDDDGNDGGLAGKIKGFFRK